jgi:hypothetical protein
MSFASENEKNGRRFSNFLEKKIGLGKFQQKLAARIHQKTII